MGLDRGSGVAYIDRTSPGAVPENDGIPIDEIWSRRYEAPLTTDAVPLHALVDRSSVEVFAGEHQLSCLTLPSLSSGDIGLSAWSGPVEVRDFRVRHRDRL
jgi:hypothetical protein